MVGGGATGAGVAVDAASRGYSVLLLEQDDFGKGTSSRSTKLVHGGVRYLAQGRLSLVRESLRERAILRGNAPHLVTDLPLIVPAYAWWERPWYGTGLKVYDALAGRSPFARSRLISRAEALRRLPTLRRERLRGGVEYHDGQFDDTRLLVNLLQTAAAHGATVKNYVVVTGITKDAAGKVDGVVARDVEADRELRIGARVVVNATGAMVDGVRRMAAPDADALIAPSQGIHLVFRRSFLPSDTAVMVPHTSDGRVMFAIPWHGYTVVGTTDTPIADPALEPVPQDDEVAFVLATAAQYLDPAPARADVTSVFAGVRPLVRNRLPRKGSLGDRGGNMAATSALSRDHTLCVDPSGLITTTGGKWTTYRSMAEETVDQAAVVAGLPGRPCRTATLRIAGETDAALIEELRRERPDLAERLDPSMPWTGADVVWAVRREMARTVEDVLARRTRVLFLDARAAVEMAPAVAELIARELGRDDAWQRREVESFAALARQYLLSD